MRVNQSLEQRDIRQDLANGLEDQSHKNPLTKLYKQRINTIKDNINGYSGKQIDNSSSLVQPIAREFR